MAMTATSHGAWQEPAFLPPLDLSDIEEHGCSTPAWIDHVAAVLELQEAMRDSDDS